MKAIVVDDEKIMLDSFLRLSSSIQDLQIVGSFEDPEKALEFALKEPVDLAFLDVRMPKMNGIRLAVKLREKQPDILIVFISAYDEYIRDSNKIGADYYIVKPYRTETLEIMMERLRLLARRQRREIYVRMFGRFSVYKNGVPVKLRGKAKEILALILSRRGREISNEEIFRTIWENRTYSNANMTVYYNALHRLKEALTREGIRDILLSTPHGQMANTPMFECDYYNWLRKQETGSGGQEPADGAEGEKASGSDTAGEHFEGEFLTEYPWSEYLMGDLYRHLFD